MRPSARVTLLIATLLTSLHADAFPDVITARQGRALDGGMTAWAVECTNCSGGAGGSGGSSGGGTIDGGFVGVSSLPLVFIGDAGVLNVNFPATQAVSAASLPLPTNASTSVLQTSGNTSLSSIDGKLPALSGGKIPVDIGASIVSVTGGITDTQLRATAVPVSLATAPSTPVTGTFWQSTQPVSLASAPTTPITAAALPLPAGAATDATLSGLLDGGIQLLSTIAAASGPAQVVFIQRPLNPFLPRCNPVRRTGCQP